ncbi:MAG: GldG family protein [Treponema sp.]|nr:GldG family protein [Treponema sp.]
MNKKQASFLCFLTLGVFLFLFLLSGTFFFRKDLTQDGIYSLSDFSKNLHLQISDRVDITYFVSPQLSRTHPLPREAADFLREYEAHSRGKIRFNQRDPGRTGDLRRVESLGIIPWQMEVNEGNVTTIATVYSGILIEYLGRERVIPLVLSLERLEYQVSSQIYSLVHAIPREIGILAANPRKDWAQDYGLLQGELFFAGYVTRVFHPGQEIPPTLPLLFVLGGLDVLDEYDLYPIDRYIGGGGNVLFAVDSIFVDPLGSFEVIPLEDWGLLAMLAQYGVILHRALVLDRHSLQLSFQVQRGGLTEVETLAYPHWVAVQDQGGNPRSPLGRNFGGLDLHWPSPLELHPPLGVSAEPLFTSSAQAWLQRDAFITNPTLGRELELEEPQTRGLQILGAALEGVFPSFFDDPYNEGPLYNRPEERRPGRIIVIGDEDFAGALAQLSRSEERNMRFLLRAAEWLSGNDELLALLDKSGQSGRLDRIGDAERRETVMAFSRRINLVFMPLGIILAGWIIIRRRRRHEL